jgi:uncharacterized protein YlxP (DUF503 family)
MPVAQLTLEIRIDHAQSLKDRRHVVRSLKDQLRQAFNVSVAEMDEATLVELRHAQASWPSPAPATTSTV